jgi:hypothetical protein
MSASVTAADMWYLLVSHQDLLSSKLPVNGHCVHVNVSSSESKHCKR